MDYILGIHTHTHTHTHTHKRKNHTVKVFFLLKTFILIILRCSEISAVYETNMIACSPRAALWQNLLYSLIVLLDKICTSESTENSG